MKYKVCIITGTRADYGLLRNLIFRLYNNEKIDFRLVVTGSHLSDKFGNTQDEIVKDGIEKYVKIPIMLEDDSKSGMAKATGDAMIKFAEYFNNEAPDLLIVLGDRYEILAAVIAARMCGIAIAHMSGGDITEGAIDDAIRHAITKMSELHFPGCEQSARRLIQMGEQPENVYNVGEPGVENCLNMNFLSRKELRKNLDFSFVEKSYCVVTFHPVTLENNTGIGQVKELIQAMDSIPDMGYIVTMANADAGGRAINDYWLHEQKKHENWLVVPSLGVVRYLSAVRYAKAVIGNSSSGIVEAPALGIPTVNIGDRQKGRMIADSVVCCEPLCESIVKAIKNAISEEFHIMAKNADSPFGDGTTSERIEKIIIEYLEKNKLKNEKRFYDIDKNRF